MSSLQTHPEEGLLLRYLDGELPGRKSRQVRGHLEACWQCRSAVEELEGAIAACMEYRKEVLQGHLPPPPTPWADLTAGFARVDSQGAAGGGGTRVGHRVTRAPLPRVSLAPAAVGLGGGGKRNPLRGGPGEPFPHPYPPPTRGALEINPSKPRR